MHVMTKITEVARGVTRQQLFIHEAPPDVAGGTEHPWASSNRDNGQDRQKGRCCCGKGSRTSTISREENKQWGKKGKRKSFYRSRKRKWNCEEGVVALKNRRATISTKKSKLKRYALKKVSWELVAGSSVYVLSHQTEAKPKHLGCSDSNGCDHMNLIEISKFSMKKKNCLEGAFKDLLNKQKQYFFRLDFSKWE